MRQTRNRSRNHSETETEPIPKPPSLPASLDQARALIAEDLHYPANLGVELRHLTARDGTPRLLVYIQGADSELVERRVFRPLRRPEVPLAGTLFTTTAPTLQKVLRAVAEGDAVLLQEGQPCALVIETSRLVKRAAGMALPPEPHKVVFGLDLTDNLALVRQRLCDPALVAQPVPARSGRSAPGRGDRAHHGPTTPPVCSTRATSSCWRSGSGSPTLRRSPRRRSPCAPSGCCWRPSSSPFPGL